MRITCKNVSFNLAALWRIKRSIGASSVLTGQGADDVVASSTRAKNTIGPSSSTRAPFPLCTPLIGLSRINAVISKSVYVLLDRFALSRSRFIFEVTKLYDSAELLYLGHDGSDVLNSYLVTIVPQL
ncbi:hypothetical protein CHS0354_031903 [Potamilus streckersoni]|uniref:Uncharacterized protein n=1 Tax=Potamilus streckersoni TaxID=2493646 RepID=A0AAE0RY99_9BIVA|nr:hypothetical protein CHS0354_031903 [Potamilus streckersoni]